MKFKFLLLITIIVLNASSINKVYAAYENNIDKNELKQLQHLIDKNTHELNSIKNNQIIFFNNLSNKKIDPIKEIGLPLLLSIVAGFIFWLIFQVIPNKRREKKLRPKIEKDLLNVSSSVYRLVELAFLHCENPVSYFKNEIHSGKVTKEEIKLALYNKAKNEKHLVNQFSNNIVIGNLIHKSTNKIGLSIERIFFFNDQLSVSEILVLEDIYQEISQYDFFNIDDTYGVEIAGITYTPVDPSLSCYSNFFFNMLNLAKRLDRIISTGKTNNLQLLYMKRNIQYYDKDYKSTLKTINLIEKKFPDQLNNLEWLKFQSMYHLNRNKSLALLGFVAQTYL
ncbi:hypothetical protein I5560_05365 [Acinetobacter baumannii]|uniref:hypothetical protein n=1 Tax=Acinetobacter baumannii TaxID=470 RepID=UPI0019012B9D|nr:hypothetical protein [Acinetobacter baumannii]MBJ9452859.1 hypothetical protein [Acinetobacter baumannii]